MNSSSGGGVILVVMLAVAVFYLVATWKLYTKAGQPGWASIVPIYNMVVFFRIAGKPGWWVLLSMIPLVNIVVYWLACSGTATRFGKGAGFALGIFFLPFIFVPLLAFGDAIYRPSLKPAY